MDRRGFLKLFGQASVGVPVAQHLGLLEELTKWVLSPKKIFIPVHQNIHAVPGRIDLLNLKHWQPIPDHLNGIPYYEINANCGTWNGLTRS